jgi:LacI family transcriptional regulator
VNPPLRQIAAQLGLSASTVSRALHQDPRVCAATTERVQAALKKAGYQLDPVVSAGMSRIRQRRFYRETLAWCGDFPKETMPWLAPLFKSVESYGARLGYAVEYFHFTKATPRELARLASIWRARGIRGVVLGPFRTGHAVLPFPWHGLAWVTIGQALDSPVLHSVVRDYGADIRMALDWLKQRGCERPCFVHCTGVRHLFATAMLQASMLHYRGAASRPPEPYHEFDHAKPKAFRDWAKSNRPDGFVWGRLPDSDWSEVKDVTADLPRVLLSPPDTADTLDDTHFVARYDVIGQASVNLLHRLLINREFGIPAYKQTVALSSIFNIRAA